MLTKIVSTTQHRRPYNGRRFVREVAATCEARGLRLTKMRRQVLELIAAAGKPVKAYNLVDKLKAARRTAAPSPMYRTLDFLLENGFIHKLESINAYVRCQYPSVVHHVQFLLCDICESATEICDDRVADLMEEQARALGFRTRGKTLEVHGVCERCGLD